MTHPTVS